MGGCSLDDLRKYLDPEVKALSYDAAGGDLVDALEDALSSDDGRLMPVLPDLIGEAVVVEQLRTLSNVPQGEFISRWFDRARTPVAETLVRATQDYLAEEAPIRWLRHIMKESADIETLFQISAVLPESSVRLQDLSFSIHDQIAQGLGTGGKGKTLFQNLRVVESLSRLAKSCALSGRHEEALLAGRNPEEAHQTRRRSGWPGHRNRLAYIPTHISDAPRRNWSADEGAAGANAARQYSDDHERLWAGSIEHEAPSKQQSRSDGAQADSLGADK
jgi:hypothetical protein